MNGATFFWVVSSLFPYFDIRVRASSEESPFNDEPRIENISSADF